MLVPTLRRILSGRSVTEMSIASELLVRMHESDDSEYDVLVKQFQDLDWEAATYFSNEKWSQGDRIAERAGRVKQQLFDKIKSIKDPTELQRVAVKYQHVFSNGGRNDDAMIRYHKNLGTKWAAQK